MLESDQPLRQMELTAEDEKLIRGFQFLSQKPVLYVLNLGEADAPRLHEIESRYAGGPMGGRKRTAVGLGAPMAQTDSGGSYQLPR